MSKSQKEYPKDPRHIDEILWLLLLKEHDVFDKLQDGKPGKSDWLKQWFKDLKSKLIEPNFSYEPQKTTSPPKKEQEEIKPTTGISGKKRTYYSK